MSLCIKITLKAASKIVAAVIARARQTDCRIPRSRTRAADKDHSRVLTRTTITQHLIKLLTECPVACHLRKNLPLQQQQFLSQRPKIGAAHKGPFRIRPDIDQHGVSFRLQYIPGRYRRDIAGIECGGGISTALLIMCFALTHYCNHPVKTVKTNTKTKNLTPIFREIHDKIQSNPQSFQIKPESRTNKYRRRYMCIGQIFKTILRKHQNSARKSRNVHSLDAQFSMRNRPRG